MPSERLADSLGKVNETANLQRKKLDRRGVAYAP